MRVRSASRRPRPAALLFALPALLALACAAPRVAPHPPIDAGASAAFAEAHAAWRSADGDARARAEAAARRALLLAPGWVAPRRFLDERAREDLLAPELLEAYRRELEARPDDARLSYLCGRLEGLAGSERFERAQRLDRAFPWALHGLAWSLAARERPLEAARLEERALALARDPYERASFAVALAAHLHAADRGPAARRILEQRIAASETSEAWRIELAVPLALFELDDDEEHVRRRGVRRALLLVAHPATAPREVMQLTHRLWLPTRAAWVARKELLAALASRGDALGDRLWGEISGSSPLALTLWSEGSAREGAPIPAIELRREQFAHGDPRRAVEAWLAELPRQVVGADGLPRDARLARLVRAARALPGGGIDAAGAEVLRELGAALDGAGWFEELLALAERVPRGEVELARELARAGLAGAGAIDAIVALVQDLERGAGGRSDLASAFDVGLGEGGYREVQARDLASFLEALGRVLPAAGEERPSLDVAASPRIGYGWVASIVHPGPSFSALDEAQGLGAAGEPVPGLARELARLGRFGVFGEMLGAEGIDGTLRRVLLVERRSGEHLGLPWAGTVVWCEGADLHSRAERSGASIAGAAVHEGFWIDVDALRVEAGRWAGLRARFDGEANSARVERALAVRGVPLREPSERASAEWLLGEADRVRLAVLRERGAGPGRLGEVELGDLVAATELHEEAHLCDRARFFPVGRKLWNIVLFLARNGFSAQRVARSLEYRAQLVALAVADEPRILLVDLLEAGERGMGPTPHTVAYVELLRDLLATLERELLAAPERWPRLDAGRRLAHQLHHLSAAELRALARTLARERGLLGPGAAADGEA